MQNSGSIVPKSPSEESTKEQTSNKMFREILTEGLVMSIKI